MRVTIQGQTRAVRTVSYDPERRVVELIDQRLLPHRFEWFHSTDYRETAQAIQDMVTRGAGAIGATAAFGFAQGLQQFTETDGEWEHHVDRVFDTLATARPTAVDPVNAMRTIRAQLTPSSPIAEQQARAVRLAQAFADEDVVHCRAIGEHGAPLIPEGARILTHCNAGWLAFVDVGSATAPIYTAHDAGRSLTVYCDETRPRLQGASLTAWELAQAGVPHHIIADNGAGWLMRRGEIDLVIVGSDRVLGRTGEVANKIGTYTKAVLAARHNIPFYVAIPLSTLDWDLESGFDIPIEERSQTEVTHLTGVDEQGASHCVRVANPGSPALNYGFDVTPASLVTGIITPLGVLSPQELWTRRAELGGPVDGHTGS